MNSSLIERDKAPKERILLFGGGLHGQTCIDVIEKQGLFKLEGIVDSILDVKSQVDGYRVLGRMKDLPELCRDFEVKRGFIGIGDNVSRKRVADEIYSLVPDFHFVNLIHPSAVLGKNIEMGQGILIGAQSMISPGCILGDFCYLHHCAILGMYNRLGKFASIGIGSLTAGKVTIGDFSAITIRVAVNDRVTIGPHSVVGSGSLVIKDIPGHVVAYGHPAKIIREREEGEPYLKSG